MPLRFFFFFFCLSLIFSSSFRLMLNLNLSASGPPCAPRQLFLGQPGGLRRSLKGWEMLKICPPAPNIHHKPSWTVATELSKFILNYVLVKFIFVFSLSFWKHKCWAWGTAPCSLNPLHSYCHTHRTGHPWDHGTGRPSPRTPRAMGPLLGKNMQLFYSLRN